MLDKVLKFKFKVKISIFIAVSIIFAPIGNLDPPNFNLKAQYHKKCFPEPNISAIKYECTINKLDQGSFVFAKKLFFAHGSSLNSSTNFMTIAFLNHNKRTWKIENMCIQIF